MYMKKIILLISFVSIVFTLMTAKNSYTGGYSSAPGKSACASSCHGGTAGTMQVSGFPASYIPGQTYTITISHSSGNKFVNVNATTRLGTTAAVAGSFVAGSGSALYTGADGGIYAPTHLVDVIVFQWKAPAAGSGPVTLYTSGFQGTSTGSKTGESSKSSQTAVEVTTGVNQILEQPHEFALFQNYPNPFNPSTTIQYELPVNNNVTLSVYNVLGKEVATLVNGTIEAGVHSVQFNAANLSSGIYFYTLRAGNYVENKKMMLLK